MRQLFVITSILVLLTRPELSTAQQANTFGPVTSDYQRELTNPDLITFNISRVLDPNGSDRVIGIHPNGPPLYGGTYYRQVYQWWLPEATIPDNSTITSAELFFTAHFGSEVSPLRVHLCWMSTDISSFSEDQDPEGMWHEFGYGDFRSIGTVSTDNAYVLHAVFPSTMPFSQAIQQSLPGNKFILGVMYDGEGTGTDLGGWWTVTNSTVKLKINFTSPAPPAPILISPANGQTNFEMGPLLHWQAVPGADNYQIFIAPSGDPNFTTGEVCWSFSASTSVYACESAYSSLYYWKVYAHTPLGGWSPSSSVWHYTTQADPGGGGGGGGCPYVSTWNGDVFHAENNIIPQSEYRGNNGKTVTDYYRLMSPPKTEGSLYVIRIDEFEHERSDFDQFKLLAIDHSSSTQVAVLQDGNIIQYTSPYHLANTMTPDGLDLSALDSFDKTAIGMTSGQSISLSFNHIINEFAQVGGYPQGGIILGGWMVPSGEGTDQCVSCGGDKKFSVGNVGSGQVMFSKPASFTFRERPSLVYVPIEKLDDNMSIRFTENVFLDYANFAVLMPDNMTKNELNLISATHSVDGASTMQLSKTDGETASLKPGESIELRFQSVPLGQDMTRDFILVTQGRYEKIGTASTKEVPHEYKLMQNYPNPFNPSTTVTYWLPENSYVSLRIYDILGQEVLKPVDGYQSAGIKTLNLDGSKLSSGIYFYKLQAGTYTETKKMIISK